MTRSPWTAARLVAIVGLVAVAGAAPGCKTHPAESPDAADNQPDAASIDATVDAIPDATDDATVDATVDAHVDATVDAAPDPIYLGIYDEVDQALLIQRLEEMSGVVPVTIGTDTVTIDERYSDAGRKRYRDYWTQYFQNLGMTVTPIDVPATGNPRAGDDLEAVLPGASPDSIIVIVHYDSIGPPGQETMNPGADDDMSGMAIMLETARVLAAHKDKLQHTVRFVAVDEEELGGLAGSRTYASYIKAKSMADGFALVDAIDDEQTGWNCKTDGLCGNSTNKWPTFDVFSCGGTFNFKALGNDFVDVVDTYEPSMHAYRACMGENSDHYAMWEIGVPSVVFSEHNPFANPHFDAEGGDTFDKIDQDYFTSIARPAITWQARLVGISP